MTVSEAAEALGISPDGIRMRIKRGTLRSKKEPNGRVYVWLTGVADNVSSVESVALISELRDQIRYLRQILEEERDARRRADTIIAQLTQANTVLTTRIPELEAPQERTGAPEGVKAEPGRAEPRPAPGGAQEGILRPWWRRRSSWRSGLRFPFFSNHRGGT